MKNNDRFVFLDDYNRPYLVSEWGENNEWWLFYWHEANKKFVSLRPINSQSEMWSFAGKKLSQEEADKYLNLSGL